MEVVFSIIIPHKNTPDLLQYCLDSIPVRNDVQVIVVDDNSDADKVDFEHFPQWGGRNYEFCLTKEGKGAGYARNVGLKHAKGTWVMFSDADDFFTIDFQQALCEITDDSPDITFFNATAIMMNDSSHSNRANHLNEMHLKYEKDPQKASLQFRYLFGEPWCKIIRRDLINSMKICFDEISIHNDTTFSYLVGHYAKSIGVNHTKVYCITESPCSLSKSHFLTKQFVRTEVFAQKNKFLYEQGVPVFDNLLLVPFCDCISKKDWKSLIKCLLIVRKYGFSAVGMLIRVLAPNRLKKLIRFGFVNRLKYSYDV